MIARTSISDWVVLVSTRLFVVLAVSIMNMPAKKLQGTTHDLRLPKRLKKSESTRGALKETNYNNIFYARTNSF